MDNTTTLIANTTQVITTALETESLPSKIANGIDLYLPPILFFTGLVCNTLVILVMRSPYFVKLSTSLYMSFNALTDNASILIILPVHWLYVNYPHAIYRGQNSDIICKFLNFLGWGSSDLGIILTSAMTMERAIAIKFPLQSVSYCTVKKARYVIVILVLIILLKDAIFLVKSTMVPLEEQAQLCGLDVTEPGIKYYIEKVQPIIHNVFLALSFVIIIINNVIILKSVRSSGAFPSYPSTVRVPGQYRAKNASYQSRASARGRQLTIMLISDSLTIVILTLPFSVITSIDTEGMDGGTRHLMVATSLYLLYVNRCANFFLYCISGERFRFALKELFVRGQKSSTCTSIFSTQKDRILRNGSGESISGIILTDSQTRSSAVP